MGELHFFFPVCVLTNAKLNTFFFTRAPVLVALALIECGMKYEDAVQFIRQ